MIKAKYQKMYTEKYKQDMDFVIIGDRYIGPFVDMDTAQKAVDAINSQFAPQPKRTRTEYIKITDSIFDLRDEFERGELYKLRNDDTYEKITCESKLGELYGYRLIYRKVEKEIDERQEFIERAKDLIDASKEADYSLGKMYDSGCCFVGASREIE